MGRITFYEPMITRAYLLGRPDTCVSIKQPRAWGRAGYYPTAYCMRYAADSKSYTISLGRFAYRLAE